MSRPVIVVINRHKVAANRATMARNAAHKRLGEENRVMPIEPVISVRVGRRGPPHYEQRFEFTGHAYVVYDPEHPLPCGATCWIEIDREWDLETVCRALDEPLPRPRS